MTLAFTSSGHAQEVTLADLQGVTIHASWTNATRFRIAQGEFTGGKTVRLQVALGPGGTIKGAQNETGWADTPGGRKTNEMTRSFEGSIGVPGKNKDRSASVLWLFEAGTLTRLGVVEVGGALLKIKFNKTGSGLICAASITLAREVGAGNRIDKSPAGGKVEVLSARPMGSPTCRVVQKS